MKKESFVNNLIGDFKANKYVYEENQSIELIRDKIKFVINQKEIINFRYNLTGELNSDDTFKLSRRFGIVVINDGTGGSPVTIKGKLVRIEESRTKVEITLKPSWVLVIMPILFGTIGIVSMAGSIITGDKKNMIGGLFLIAVPIFWSMIKFSKNFYKSEFEKALDISQYQNI